MKVLQVNCVYNTGSTGKITYDLHYGLQAAGIESVICYGRGEKTKDKNVYKICGEFESHIWKVYTMFNGMIYSGCWRSTKQIERVIEVEKPNVVHLQCINGYFVNIYHLVTWLKTKKIPTVLTLHAEFMYTGTCGHALDCERWKTGCGKCPQLRKEIHSLFIDNTHRSWVRMKEAFDGFDCLKVVSVSPWLMERAKLSPILADKDHSVIFNGLDTGVFHPYDTRLLRDQMGLTGKQVVFHATPSFSVSPDHFKGGYYIMELARTMPETIFLVAGPTVGEISAPSNLILLGRVNDQSLLAQYYSMADATVITSKRETFSMVTAESLCCGTPVVGFKAGGPEMIALKEMSSFVSYGDMEGLVKLLQNNSHKHLEMANNVREMYSKQRMIEQYIECYEKLCR